MMRETVEQRRCHLRIAEHARPLAKGQISGHDHRGPLVEAANQMEQKLSASLGERQIAEFIEDDEVGAREIIGEARLATRPSFGLEPIDQIDGVEEPATRSGADATARDRHRQMRLAGAGPANQDDVALLRDEAAAGEIAHQALEDLSLEQIAREALRFVLAFERRGEDLVIGVLHSEEFELAHQIEDFGSLHGRVLLSWSYRAQSATGACRSLSASGARMVAAGPGSRWRVRMLMTTSDEWTPSDIACAQAASTAGNPSVRTVARMATI